MPPAARKTAKKKAAKKANKAKKKVKKAAARKKTSRKSGKRRTPSSRKAPARAATREPVGPTIHCTLALTGEWSMVLPTSAIAEITDYAPPAPLENTPDWLLGQVEWEDWQVPVISFGALIDGEPPETPTAHARIMVVKSLSSTSRVPFIGVMVREIPKLAKISESELEVTGDQGKSLGVHCKVKLGRQEAVIPDLERLSQLIGHAAYGEIEQDGSVANA